MRRVYAFHFLFWAFGLGLYAQTITVQKPVITPSQEKYKAVEASNLIHVIEGSSALYKISVAGFDSIASVTSLRYNYSTDITSKCHLDKGVLTIDDVTINNLMANTIQNFKLSLIVREKGKSIDTEYTAETMSIMVYSAPSGKEVTPPNYLTFYKDTGGNLTWTFKGTGGNAWNCTWNIDNTDNKGNSYIMPRIRKAKTSTLKLTAKNIAPDGITEWDKYEENWQIVVLPEATVQPTVADKTNGEFFQDQNWDLSVAVDGGNSSGWEYSWTVDGVKTDNSGNSFILSINDSERSADIINRKVVLTVKNKLPAGTKPTSEKLEWNYSYSAKFYPCPEVRFADNYPHNICDGDIITLGVAIFDSQGKSLINDPNYQWDISWDGVKSQTYTYVGKNSNNSEGDVHNIRCDISGKLKGISKPYSKTLQHQVNVWPKPYVQPLTEEESKYVSCGGNTIKMSLHISGGQKDGWEFFYGKKDGTQTSSKESTFLLPIERESQRSTQPITDEYTIKAVNSVEGVVRYEKTLSMSIDVYPAPWMPNDVVIKDKNRQNAPVVNGIREGNEVLLSCEECYGGYPNAWKYSWSKDNYNLSNTKEVTTTIEDVYSGDKKNDNQSVTFICSVNNYYGNEPWAIQEYKKQLTIYHKPKTPTSLACKGDGTSGTMIATTSVSDADLDGHDYYLVFGYIDNTGQMHDAASQRQLSPGEIRWSTQIPASEINNPSNALYVYALWKYGDGVEITSGLCFVNNVDEYWDGSSYSGNTRAVITNATSINDIDCDAKTQMPYEYYSTKGIKSQTPFKGLNIVKMSDGSIKKVMIK